MSLTTMPKEDLFEFAYKMDTVRSQCCSVYLTFNKKTKDYISEIDDELIDQADEITATLFKVVYRCGCALRRRGFWKEYLAYKKAKEEMK